jgi:hypothetical protein
MTNVKERDPSLITKRPKRRAIPWREDQDAFGPMHDAPGDYQRFNLRTMRIR